MRCGRKYFGALEKAKPLAVAWLIAGISNAAFAASDRAPSKPPIILESTGAYEVGGKVIANPSDPSLQMG
jgi:hypothetical protein